MYIDVLMILAGVLYIALAYFLAHTYMRTRNLGFIWLSIAFLLLPLVELTLNIFKKRYLDAWIAGHGSNWVISHYMTPGALYQFTAITQSIVTQALVLVSVYYLSKGKFEKSRTAI